MCGSAGEGGRERPQPGQRCSGLAGMPDVVVVVVVVAVGGSDMVMVVVDMALCIVYIGR